MCYLHRTRIRLSRRRPEEAQNNLLLFEGEEEKELSMCVCIASPSHTQATLRSGSELRPAAATSAPAAGPKSAPDEYTLTRTQSKEEVPKYFPVSPFRGFLEFLENL